MALKAEASMSLSLCLTDLRQKGAWEGEKNNLRQLLWLELRLVGRNCLDRVQEECTSYSCLAHKII